MAAESTQADFVGQDAPLGEEADTFKDLCAQAVWAVSGAKPGNGVDQLIDDDPASYWQSDGTAPHLINIQFARKTSIKQLSLYLDHSLDESYTPKKFCIRAGSTNHDLRDVAIVNLHEPQGWINIPLGDPTALGDNRYLRAHLVQICILVMHQNGRDTHVRQVKIYGPKEPVSSHPVLFPEFVTPELAVYSTIR